jgi:catechol 2,3-dioxygenase-like lactoylglutathione lyase family enzyme
MVLEKAVIGDHCVRHIRRWAMNRTTSKTLLILVMGVVLACAPSDSPAQDVQLPATNGAFYAVSVRNIDEAVTWYTQHLGFKIESRGENDERKGALLSRPGAILELGEFVGAMARDELRSGLESHEVYGVFKLGFTTANLDSSFEFLEERGVEIFFPIVTASDGNRTFGIRDLEGNIIQFFGK